MENYMEKGGCHNIYRSCMCREGYALEDIKLIHRWALDYLLICTLDLYTSSSQAIQNLTMVLMSGALYMRKLN